MPMLLDKKILVVDDERDNISTFSLILGKAGYEIVGAESGKEALAKIKETFFPVALIDYRMPVMNGIQLLKKISDQSPETIVALVTAYGKPDTIREAYEARVFDFIDKPVDNELLLLKVNAAYEQFLARLKTPPYRKDIMHRYPLEAIVHQCLKMKELIGFIRKVARTDETVLILGENGTGKELFARAIHWLSPRRNQIFCPVNAASFSETVLESELFGHEKGAFTGATNTRIGFFETASEGTLFLDEIGEISPNMQAKLLRVLEEKKIYRLGSSKPKDINTRVILATNQNLDEKVKAEQFRKDLFYRINSLAITVPPLRERKTDIPLIIDFLLKGHQVEVSDDVLEALVNYEYPGNVRELENILKKALFLQEDGTIKLQHLPPHVSGISTVGTGVDDIFELDWKRAKDAFEKLYLEHLMQHTAGIVTRAAELSGIDRSDLHRKLKRHNIKYRKNGKG